MCVSVRVRMLSIESLAGQCSRNGAVFRGNKVNN